MKQFRCGDVVPGCLGVFEAADEQGILTAVAAHARQDHGMSEVPDELVDQVRARIVDV